MSSMQDRKPNRSIHCARCNQLTDHENVLSYLWRCVVCALVREYFADINQCNGEEA